MGCGKGSPESWLQMMLQSTFTCARPSVCLPRRQSVGCVSLLSGTVGLGSSYLPWSPGTGCVYRLWVFMAGKPDIEGILRPPFEDDTARSQCVCEGKEVWHCARETVNLLGRLNFMFK